MFIATCKGGAGGKYTYIRLMENYVNDKGRQSTRVIKTFGRKDILEKEDPDILEKLKARYQGQRAEMVAQNRAQELKKQLSESAAQGHSFCPLLFYSNYLIKAVWDSQLHLDRKFKDLQTRQTKAKFDVNAAAFFMTLTKILDPHSILFSFGDKDSFVGNPGGGLTLDNFYDLYTYLAVFKDSIMGFVNRSVCKVTGKGKSSLLFYDVTNCYFETALSDQECGRRQCDFVEKLAEEMARAKSEGRLDESCFDEDGALNDSPKSLEFLEGMRKRKIEFLRMRGPSKEHRFDLPLVSIALVINEDGIPIDFSVYAGNASEYKTMSESIDTLKAKYNVEQSIVVADRGLNSAENLTMLTEKKLGFLVAQKVSCFDKEMTQVMFDEDGYKPIDEKHPEIGRYKVIPNWVKKGKRKSQDVTCTLVITFDEKRKKRDLAVLEVWEELVLKKQQDGQKLKPKQTGWSSIAQTAEKAESKIIGIDQEAFERKRKLAGYAALVYKSAKPEAQAAPIPNDSIASVYHRLNQIEDCFRIMKHNVGLRPMYVRNSNQIKGHILICVLALIILKLIQRRLKEQNTALSFEEIINTLNRATTAVYKTGDSLLFNQVSRPQNLRRGRERLSDQQILDLINTNKIQGSYLPALFKAVGLEMPATVTSMHEMARSLGTRFHTPGDAVSPLVLALM